MKTFIKKLLMVLLFIGPITSVNSIECNVSPEPFSVANHPGLMLVQLSPDLPVTLSVGAHERLTQVESIPAMGLLGRDDGRADEGSGLKQKPTILLSASLPNLANLTNDPYRGDLTFLAKEAAEPDAWTLLLCGLVIGTFIASHRLSGI